MKTLIIMLWRKLMGKCEGCGDKGFLCHMCKK